MRLLLAFLLLAAQAPSPERFLEVEAGTRLRVEPDASSRSLAVVDEAEELVVLEEREGWVRVRYQDLKGWFRPGGPDSGPAGLAVAPRPEMLPEADAREAEASARRAAQGRALLGRGTVAVGAGGLCVETDVRDAGLRSRALEVAGELEAVYRERTGLLRPAAGERTVLVFERRASYRAFEASDARSAGASRAGHTFLGVAALSAEGPPDEALALLVHELSHLLSHSILRRVLPPWLEEGVAEDLAWSELDQRGRPILDTFRKPWTTVGSDPSPGRLLIVQRSSSTYAVERLLRRHRSEAVTSLGELLGMGPEGFERPGSQSTVYALSGLFVRFLNAPERRQGFRAYLAAAADGEPVSHEALLAHLGEDLAGLQAAFDAYLSRLRPF